MARNLAKAGHSLALYNRTRERASRLAAELGGGARVVSSPADAAASGIVCTMLADDHAVEQLVFGENGISAALPAGGTHLSHSTISVALSQRLEQEHHRRGQHYVSAPVFGRPEAAADARLVVAAAGSREAIDRCRPIFDAIGAKMSVVGAEPWKANLVKLSGNFMIATLLETFSEAFAVLRKGGVDPALFLDIVNGLFRSPVYEGYGGAIVAQRFEPAGFALKLGLKDVRLMLAASDAIAAPMPIASVLHDRFLTAVARGQGDIDWASVSRIAASDAGLE